MSSWSDSDDTSDLDRRTRVDAWARIAGSRYDEIRRAAVARLRGEVVEPYLRDALVVQPDVTAHQLSRPPSQRPVGIAKREIWVGRHLHDLHFLDSRGNFGRAQAGSGEWGFRVEGYSFAGHIDDFPSLRSSAGPSGFWCEDDGEPFYRFRKEGRRVYFREVMDAFVDSAVGSKAKKWSGVRGEVVIFPSSESNQFWLTTDLAGDLDG